MSDFERIPPWRLAAGIWLGERKTRDSLSVAVPSADWANGIEGYRCGHLILSGDYYDPYYLKFPHVRLIWGYTAMLLFYAMRD